VDTAESNIDLMTGDVGTDRHRSEVRRRRGRLFDERASQVDRIGCFPLQPDVIDVASQSDSDRGRRVRERGGGATAVRLDDGDSAPGGNVDHEARTGQAAKITGGGDVNDVDRHHDLDVSLDDERRRGWTGFDGDARRRFVTQDRSVNAVHEDEPRTTEVTGEVVDQGPTDRGSDLRDGRVLPAFLAARRERHGVGEDVHALAAARVGPYPSASSSIASA